MLGSLTCFVLLCALGVSPVQAEPFVSTLATGFDGSGGVTVGPDDCIYVGDFGSGPSNGTQIVKITPDGMSSVFATGVGGATGGRFDSQGNLFWSGYGASQVFKIDSMGNVQPFASIPGPVAIAIDDSDNLYVASYDSNSIRKVTPSGTVSTFATSFLFNGVNGLTSDGSGGFYASNFDDGRILQISSTGNVSTLAVVPGGNSVNVAYLDGLIYVTARSTHRIFTVTPSGTVSVFAGTGVRGNEDGPLLSSRFSFPNSIGVSNDGTRLYVNDVAAGSPTFHPNVLRVIDLMGTISIEPMSFGRIKAAYR